MKKIALLIALLGLTAMGFQGPYTENEKVSFPSNCLDGNKQFINSTQNITIRYPNGSVFINNTAMQEIETGQFRLNFTVPNKTGTYTVAKTCTDSIGNTAQGGDSFEVIDFERETGMPSVAVSILVLGFIGFVFITAQQMMKQKVPQEFVTKRIGRFFNINSLGVFLFLAGTWMLLVVYRIITYLAVGTEYYSILHALMVPVIVIIAFFNIAYLTLYILFLIYIQWGENKAWWKIKSR